MTHRQISILFYTSWLIVSIFQALYTQLIGDEAYYWVYSQQLAWGYFDHPPIVAVFIKAGYFLFKNELGVRLLTILAGVASIYFWEKLVKPKNLSLFYIMVASVGIFHFIGFLALPDAPLLLFASIFFLVYRSFIDRPTLLKSLFLGLIIALMLMSKYHGILIVGFILLSNLRLFRQKHFYLVLFSSLLFFLPHILWQYENGFPTMKYHLLERSQVPYNYLFTLEYILSQLFILGPITGLVFFFGFFKHRAVIVFEKGLKWVFAGGFLFFLLMSFKGRVEAHWTLFTLVPGLYFGYYYLENHDTFRRILKAALIPSLLLVFILRVLIVFETNWSLGEITDQFHQKYEIVQAVSNKAGPNPVAYMNSYQLASWYQFYTQKPAFSLNNIYGRKNQYDLWHSAESFRGDTVLLIPNYHVDGLPLLEGMKDEIQYVKIPDFQSFGNVKIQLIELPKRIQHESTFTQKISIYSDGYKNTDFNANPVYPSFLMGMWFKGNELIKEETLLRLGDQNSGDNFDLNIQSPRLPGNYTLQFGIRTGWIPASINSNRYPLSIY